MWAAGQRSIRRGQLSGSGGLRTLKRDAEEPMMADS